MRYSINIRKGVTQLQQGHSNYKQKKVTTRISTAASPYVKRNNGAALQNLSAYQYSYMQQSYKPVVLLIISIALHVVSKVLLAYFSGF